MPKSEKINKSHNSHDCCVGLDMLSYDQMGAKGVYLITNSFNSVQIGSYSNFLCQYLSDFVNSTRRHKVSSEISFDKYFFKIIGWLLSWTMKKLLKSPSNLLSSSLKILL